MLLAVIGSIKIKWRADDSIDKYKTHLVVGEFTQQEGIDYLESFSLVAKLST